jgi:4-amino-4-deoxy-L-arabinose transferase-like glycosyltransferase
MTTIRQDPPLDPEFPAGPGFPGEPSLPAGLEIPADLRPPIDAATAAAWRRQLRWALDAAPVPGTPDTVSGTPAPVPPAPVLRAARHEFAGTQQAGLAAMIRLTGAPSVPEIRPRWIQPASAIAPPAQARPAPAIAPAPSPAPGARRFAHLPRLLWLVAILAMQAALSGRLIAGRTAFNDEALYLWAGRVEWSHWLHGTPVPYFQTYFSGAPVVYPPLGALANAVGGLTGARILSLLFMMGATVLLWSTVTRLFGWRAAAFGAGLWVMLGPTQHLGAYATYDAMALFLVALAAWCATGSRDQEDATGWMLAAAGALALANATKYASALFDPVVIALAVTSAWPGPGGKIAIRRGTFLTACAAGAITLMLRFGGSLYLRGIAQTTLTRAGNTSRVLTVLGQSWAWIGVVVVIGAIGIALSWRGPARLTVTLLALAALLVPAEQARIHTTTSLNKHVDFGAWFAAVAAGYALSRLVALIRPRLVRITAVAAAAGGVLASAQVGAVQARDMLFGYWGNEAPLITALRPLTSHGGQFLAEGQYIPVYYLPGSRWQNWSNTRSVRIPGGSTISGPVGSQGNPATYQMLISAHYFAVVLLTSTDTISLDQAIARDLAQNPGYHIAAHIPFGPGRNGHYTIWVWRPGSRPSAP